MQQVLSKNADIYIIITVVVDIHNAYARAPDICFDSGFFCNILKLVVSFIDIEPAGDLVAGKKYILFPVIIKITDANATAHISKLVDKGMG